MQTGEVRERNLTGIEFSMDFPIVNGDFTGLKNRYGYCQVVNSIASSTSGDYKKFKTILLKIVTFNLIIYILLNVKI